MQKRNIGKVIGEIAKEKGITQSELADMLHCDERTVNRFCSGKRKAITYEEIITYAEFLHIDLKDLDI